MFVFKVTCLWVFTLGIRFNNGSEWYVIWGGVARHIPEWGGGHIQLPSTTSVFYTYTVIYNETVVM